jgi:hypothetical protein
LKLKSVMKKLWNRPLHISLAVLRLCARGLTLHNSHSSAEFKIDFRAVAKLWGTNADVCLNSSIESENKIFQPRSSEKLAFCVLFIKLASHNYASSRYGEYWLQLGLQSVLFIKCLA